MPNEATKIYLSEKIKELQLLNEELKNIVLKEPSFDRPSDRQNKATSNTDLLRNLGVNFTINGLTIFQWETGQSIGSAIFNSALQARQELIRIAEGKFRYQAVKLGQDFQNKIKENASSILDSGEKLEIQNPKYEYYSKPKIETDNPSLGWISQNSRISNTPDRILNTNFQNDLSNFITQIEELQNFQKDQSVLPFYFENINNNETCFFNAYFDNISENISANWNKLDFFGRTQGISKYINSEWTISVSFNIVLDWESDINYMYKKIDWLKRMNYPKYNQYKSISEVPLIKFTIGNLFSSVSGFISSLSIDYDMSADWEIQKGKQLPRKIMINMDFQTIKEEMPSNDTIFYDNIDYDEKLVYYRR